MARAPAAAAHGTRPPWTGESVGGSRPPKPCGARAPRGTRRGARENPTVPEDIQSELRIWRAQAREVNTLLELHLGPQHAFKIKTGSAPKAPLSTLRERVDHWVNNFSEVFKAHIDALIAGRRKDAPRTLTERIRKFR